jgi:hypothetical protein
MRSPLHDSRAADLSAGTLPTVPAGELSEMLHSLSAESTAAQARQNSLPPDVRQALETLQEVLAPAPSQPGSNLAGAITLSANQSVVERERFISELSSEIVALYFTGEPLNQIKARSNQLRGALQNLHNHFRGVACSLAQSGYKHFSVIPTRNSFADTWHVHHFLTYVLYCGREIGTEVLLDSRGLERVTIRSRKSDWMRKSHDVLGFNTTAAQTAISDTAMGLILPEEVTHRARHSISLEGRELTNLALILMAFK